MTICTYSEQRRIIQRNGDGAILMRIFLNEEFRLGCEERGRG